MSGQSALDLVNAAIEELEARLNLREKEEAVLTTFSTKAPAAKSDLANAKPSVDTKESTDLPDVCKLEFKVGVITKVWVHESADKLYCEEIDVGEDVPRQIASGLRSHFTLDEMLGQRLLVVANLKPKNLVGFKSHGMVLCASSVTNDVEKVEFVEPPLDAAIGEVISFDGLPQPDPWTPNLIEKKKVFAAAAQGMMTNAEGIAVWNGHAFMTTVGPCRTRSIVNGSLR
jgi:aminoacyl tRNA synthase complex-interacting multifunctional protein 1